MVDQTKKNQKAIEQGKDAAAEQTAKAVAANSALPELSASDVEEAQKEGMKEAAKEAAKDTYQYLTDGNLPGDPPARQFNGMHDIMQYEPLLSLDPAAFADAIKAKADGAVPEEKVAGLLELERSGQNRTPYVQAMCKRLGVKSPFEVTNAGPGFTNDLTPVTAL